MRCLRCGGPGSAWHHRRGRSVRDEHTHHPCNGVLLCETCHRWAHAYPRLARETGFIVSRHVALPGTVPVEGYFGFPILLDCAGDYQNF